MAEAIGNHRLSMDEERRLIKIAQTKKGLASRQSMGELIDCHMGFVRSVVDRQRHLEDASYGLDDMLQNGIVGLVDAIERFDPKHRCWLATFAYYRILQAIQGGSGRPRLNGASARRRHPRRVQRFLNSFDCEPSPLDHLLIKEELDKLRAQFGRFRALIKIASPTNRDGLIFCAREGIGVKSGTTYASTGLSFGLSRERVRQICVGIRARITLLDPSYSAFSIGGEIARGEQLLTLTGQTGNPRFWPASVLPKSERRSLLERSRAMSARNRPGRKPRTIPAALAYYGSQ